MRAVPVVVVLVVASAASAGSLRGTHEKTLKETSHRVEVELDGRVVRVREARRIENRDRGADEAVLAVDVVERGAAVGMRARVGGGWATGQVMESAEAGERYDALTTGGAPGGRRGPALLAWTTEGELALTAFPVRHGRPVDLEIESVAAPCVVDGLALTWLPVVEPGDGLAAPSVRVRRGARRSWIVRGGVPPAELEDRWSRLVERCPPDRAGDRADAVVWRLDGGPSVATGLARLDLASGRQLVRLEVDVAHELAPLPRRARVVFVIDASVSQGPDGVAAQLALAKGAMAHVPDADVEIVLYRRHAAPVFGRFEAAALAPGLLAKVPDARLAVENGSDLDAGLALAGGLLRRAASGGRPARVIAFTDDLLRDALTPELLARALGALPEGAVLHLVSLAEGGAGAGFARADDHPFAAAVARTGGMTVRMGWSDVADAAVAMHGLMQPLTVDAVSIEVGAGGPQLAIDEELPAGESLRLHGWTTRGAAPSAGPFVLHGRIWGRAIDRTVAVAPELEAALPALVVGDDELWRQLDAAEQLDAARRAHAVSPVTSILADPGAPATSYGEEVITGGCGCDGPSHFSGHAVAPGYSVKTGRGPALPRVDPEGALRRLLDAAIAGCIAVHGGTLRSLAVEVTYEEVVAVAADASGAKLQECASEAAWDLALDAKTFRVPHARYTLE